jgi:hypothetical protein
MGLKRLLATSLLILAPAAYAQDQSAQTLSDWATANVQINGWEAGDGGGDLMAYWRSAPPSPDGHKRQWQRYEYRVPQHSYTFAYSSAVDLIEYTCDGRYRSITEVLYSKNNMEGDTVETAVTENSAWLYIVPGSISAALEYWTCAYKKQADDPPSVAQLERLLGVTPPSRKSTLRAHAHAYCTRADLAGHGNPYDTGADGTPCRIIAKGKTPH